MFVIVFNKIFTKLQMTRAEEDGEAYFTVSEDFKRSAEHSFVIATSDLCLCSRITYEYSNGRDAIVQVPRRFNRSPCASGLNLHHDSLRKTLKTMLRTLP